MSDEDDERANTSSELFTLLEKNWQNIARHLTASYSPRRKSLLLQDFSSKLAAIEQNVQASAAAGNGDEANHWRRADFFVRSIIHELEMWLAIHNNEIPAAWNAFCSAEDNAARVAGWLPDYSFAQERVRHLAEVERVVFPHQSLFLSSGLIVSKETCTLCGSDYGTCGHLAGAIYNGTVAWRRGEKIQEVLHLSLVPEPSDKRCRIMSTVDGIDPLSGEVTSSVTTKQPRTNVRRQKTATTSPKSKRKKRPRQ